MMHGISNSTVIRLSAVSFLLLGFMVISLAISGGDEASASDKTDKTRKIDQCFYAHDVDGFETSRSSDHITISTSRGEKYELTLGAGCLNADSALAISVRGRSGFSRICGNLDGTVSYNSMGIVESCPIVGVRHIPRPPKDNDKPKSEEAKP
jgi:hypothetical protein